MDLIKCFKDTIAKLPQKMSPNYGSQMHFAPHSHSVL